MGRKKLAAEIVLRKVDMLFHKTTWGDYTCVDLFIGQQSQVAYWSRHLVGDGLNIQMSVHC